MSSEFQKNISQKVKKETHPCARVMQRVAARLVAPNGQVALCALLCELCPAGSTKMVPDTIAIILSPVS
jgi:hypothetical protein